MDIRKTALVLPGAHPARLVRRFGARAWWHADYGHDRSATIASWKDLVGLYELTAAGAARPSYAATGVNGRPGIAFDGIGQYMTIAGAPTWDAGSGMSLYAVFVASGTAANASIVTRYSTTAADALWWFQIHAGADTDDGASAISETGTNTTRFSATSTSQDLSTGSVVDALFHWDGTTITHYKGATAATGTACAGAKTQPTTPMEVGRIPLAGPVYATMTLRHLAIFGRGLSAREYVALREYAIRDAGVTR